jgi:hypothetical protein
MRVSLRFKIKCVSGEFVFLSSSGFLARALHFRSHYEYFGLTIYREPPANASDQDKSEEPNSDYGPQFKHCFNHISRNSAINANCRQFSTYRTHFHVYPQVFLIETGLFQNVRTTLHGIGTMRAWFVALWPWHLRPHGPRQQCGLDTPAKRDFHHHPWNQPRNNIVSLSNFSMRCPNLLIRAQRNRGGSGCEPF